MLYLTRIIVILTWIIVRKGDERMPLYNRLKEHRPGWGSTSRRWRPGGCFPPDHQPDRAGGLFPSVTLALKLAKICGVAWRRSFPMRRMSG